MKKCVQRWQQGSLAGLLFGHWFLYGHSARPMRNIPKKPIKLIIPIHRRIDRHRGAHHNHQRHAQLRAAALVIQNIGGARRLHRPRNEAAKANRTANADPSGQTQQTPIFPCRRGAL